MVLPWLLAIVGAVLVIVAFVIRRALRPRQDRIIRTGGFSVDQIRVVRRAIIRGTFPADPALRDVTIAYARQGAINLPLGFRSTPLLLVGATLMVSVLYAVTSQLAFGVTLQVLYAGLTVFMLIQNARALRGCRRVIQLAESMPDAVHVAEPPTQPGVASPS